MAEPTDRKSTMTNSGRKASLWIMLSVVVAAFAIAGWYVMFKGWAPYEWLELSETDRDGLRRVKTTKVVLEQGSVVEGATIAQWTEKWWLWLLQAPNVHDPMRDNNGEKCQFGQHGPVWFIAGAYAQKDVARRCTIPEGRHILIPIANGFTRPRPLKNDDCSSQLAGVEADVLAIDDPYFLLNGKEVPAIRARHREKTGKCFDSGTGRELSATDGYWIMLKPLPAGEYKLEFGLRDLKANKQLLRKIAYSITVAPATTKLAEYQPWPVLPEGGVDAKTIVEMPVTPLFDSGHVMRRVAGIIARDGVYVLVDGNPAPAGSVNSFQFVPKDLAIIERATPEIAAHMAVPLSIWIAPPERDHARFVTSALSEEDGPSVEWRKKTNADLRRILLTALDKTKVVTDEDISGFTNMHHYRWDEFSAHRESLNVPGIDAAPRSRVALQPGQFGAPVKTQDAADAKDALTISASPPPKDIANGAEIAVVSGYEVEEQSRTGTRVRVVLDRPGKNVLLVLTSYERIAWYVEASPNTRVRGILVGNRQNESTVNSKVDTKAYFVEFPYVPQADSREFSSVVAKLNQMFGVAKVDSLRSNYGLPPVVTITEIDKPTSALTLAGPGVEKPEGNFEFNLILQDYSQAKWTLTGPGKAPVSGYMSGGKFVMSPDGSTVYSIKDDKLTITRKGTSDVYVAALPSNFPQFSWAMDIAYDSRRDIVSIISLGGEGFFYRFDAKARKWIDFRSANNVDVYSMTYDRAADQYVAWTSENALMFISGDGNALQTHRIAEKLPAFSRHYSGGGPGSSSTLRLAANGNNVALINFNGSTVKNIWQYDAKARTGKLTFQSKNEER